jgi:hypothetical protein
VDLRTSGAITKSDFAKIDAAAEVVRTKGPNAIIQLGAADHNAALPALEAIRGWAFHMARQERRDYAAKVYQQLAGCPPLDTPGVVAATNGPTVNTTTTDGGGVLDTVSSWVTQVTNGPSKRIGTAAGDAAGEKVKGTIIVVGALLAAALVVAVVLIRRR